MLRRLRESYSVEPAVLRQTLLTVLAERRYDVVSLSDWSLLATRGSAGRNVLLGGFAQRMEFRFDVYADPASGVILDGGVAEEASALAMGGAIGAKKTSDELSAIFAGLGAHLRT